MPYRMAITCFLTPQSVHGSSFRCTWFYLFIFLSAFVSLLPNRRLVYAHGVTQSFGVKRPSTSSSSSILRVQHTRGARVVVWTVSKGRGPKPTHFALTNPSGLFARPKPNTSNIPILRSWCACISVVDLCDPAGEIVTKVASLLVHDTGGSPMSSPHRVRYPLPGQLCGSRPTTRLQVQQHKDCLLRWAQRCAGLGQHCLPAIPLSS